MSKKLVAIFTSHLDNFIMTYNLSSTYQLRNSGSGQFLLPGQFYLSPGLPDARFASVRAGAKIAPWWLARRDSFAAKAPGLMVGVAAPPPLSAHTRWPLAFMRGFV